MRMNMFRIAFALVLPLIAYGATESASRGSVDDLSLSDEQKKVFQGKYRELWGNGQQVNPRPRELKKGGGMMGGKKGGHGGKKGGHGGMGGKKGGFGGMGGKKGGSGGMMGGKKGGFGGMGKKGGGHSGMRMMMKPRPPRPGPSPGPGGAPYFAPSYFAPFYSPTSPGPGPGPGPAPGPAPGPGPGPSPGPGPTAPFAPSAPVGKGGKGQQLTQFDFFCDHPIANETIPVTPTDGAPDINELGTVFIYNDEFCSNTACEVLAGFVSGTCTRVQAISATDPGVGECLFTYSIDDPDTGLIGSFQASGELFDVINSTLTVHGGTEDFLGVTGDIVYQPIYPEGGGFDVFTEADFYIADFVLYLPDPTGYNNAIVI